MLVYMLCIVKEYAYSRYVCCIVSVFVCSESPWCDVIDTGRGCIISTRPWPWDRFINEMTDRQQGTRGRGREVGDRRKQNSYYSCIWALYLSISLSSFLFVFKIIFQSSGWTQDGQTRDQRQAPFLSALRRGRPSRWQSYCDSSHDGLI